MTPEDFLARIVDPGLSFLAVATGLASDDRARVLLLAIAGQESGWLHRLQIPTPVARGFWQFERGGGVRGVLQHAASRDKAAALCEVLHVPNDESTVYEAIAWNDHLAVGMARLLLWTDPRPLPAVGDVDAGYAYYSRCWRPGRPHPEVWPERYAAALAAAKDGKR